MKKHIIFVLALTAALALAGYAGRPDGTVGTPELGEIAGYTQEQLDEKLIGRSQEELHSAWGKPDGMLSGFWGDIYHVPDGYESIILYYDADGTVETIKADHRNDTKQRQAKP